MSEHTEATPTATTDTGSEESRVAQDSPTKSVGQRLKRENHDGKAPLWKRLLGKR